MINLATIVEFADEINKDRHHQGGRFKGGKFLLVSKDNSEFILYFSETYSHQEIRGEVKHREGYEYQHSGGYFIVIPGKGTLEEEERQEKIEVEKTVIFYSCSVAFGKFDCKELEKILEREKFSEKSGFKVMILDSDFPKVYA